MSVEAMAVVLHHSRARGTARLVLLGIANHEGDGGSWPTVRTLAKYAAVDPRNVTAAIAKLVELGEVDVEHQQGGDRDCPEWQRPNRYRVTLECPHDCDRTTRHRTRREQLELTSERTRQPVDNRPADRVMPASPGDASIRGAGDASIGGPLMPASPKPSTNHPGNQGGAVGLSTTDRARGAQPVETDGQRIARENRERREAMERGRASDEVVRARAAEARAALAAARERRAGSSS